jgi:hypothetical protein
MLEHIVVEDSPSTANCMTEVVDIFDCRRYCQSSYSLSMVRYRLGCTRAADVSTGVLEMLEVDFYSLSLNAFSRVILGPCLVSTLL